MRYRVYDKVSGTVGRGLCVAAFLTLSDAIEFFQKYGRASGRDRHISVWEKRKVIVSKQGETYE